MRQVQVVPKQGFRLFAAMVAKEAELARKNKGTFRRRGPKRKNSARWFHVKFKGQLALKRGTEEVVEIRLRSKQGAEWQLLGAIVGFIDRNFSPRVRAISIQYGE